MAVAKDQIRQIITENNITSVADVYALLKDSCLVYNKNTQNCRGDSQKLQREIPQ